MASLFLHGSLNFNINIELVVICGGVIRGSNPDLWC